MQEKNCVRSLLHLEVVNLCDGKKLGYVTDIAVDVTSGQVAALEVLLDDGKCFSLGKAEKIMLPFCRVERLGENVILCSLPPQDPCFLSSSKRKGRS